MKSIKKTLIEARDLISDIEHWTQQSYARENTGMEVYPNETNAYCFCAIGAIAKVSGTTFRDDGLMITTPEHDAALDLLQKSSRALFDYSVTVVNDADYTDRDDVSPDVAHKNILAVFSKAIAGCAEA